MAAVTEPSTSEPRENHRILKSARWTALRYCGNQESAAERHQRESRESPLALLDEDPMYQKYVPTKPSTPAESTKPDNTRRIDTIRADNAVALLPVTRF